MKNKYLKVRCVAGALFMMMLCVPAPLWARKPTFNVAGRESSGFNALDHVLQRPLGNDTFPAGQHFGNNMFIGIGAGASVVGDDFDGLPQPGARISGRLGGWITPVHGLRLEVDAGLHSVHHGVKRTWFGAVKFEYLVNFSSLLRGHNPSRRFELIGAVGPEYQRIRQDGGWGNEYGVGASMQMRFNVAPSLYLYLEPHMGVLFGSRYDGSHDWRRIRTDVSMNLGLGYRILSGARRAAGSTHFEQRKDDNLFFGVGAGIWDMMRPSFPRHMLTERNLMAMAYIGKMFSGTSGLRLAVDAGEYDNGRYNKKFGVASLDYVLNLNTLFSGYRPREVFQLLLNVGADAAYVNNDNRVYPGVNAALTAMFRLNHNWGLFIEPQIHAFSHEFASKIGAPYSPLSSVALGLRYNVGDFSRLFPESYAEYASQGKHWFLTGGVGASFRMRDGYGTGGATFVGFGKRFTPVSSWRVTVDGGVYPRLPIYVSAMLSADYMFSLTTSTCGYDPDRVFDLHGVLGVMGGVANYAPTFYKTYGVKAGLHAVFRLNEHLDLFVEPQALVLNGPAANGSSIWSPDVRVMVGLNYRLGTPDGGRGRLSETIYGDRRNFVSLAGAPAAYSGGRQKMAGGLDISIGRWFSMVSGARVTYANDWLNGYGHLYYVGTAHMDYLLNMTSLMDRSASRRFHIIGALGAGVAFCGNSRVGSSVGPAAVAGVQFRYNLPANIDIHIEPNITAWANRVVMDFASPHRFTVDTRLSVGASYRF